MFTILIIDDEALARKRIRQLLHPYRSDLVIAGECHTGAEAIEMIRRIEPDLIFLDIQMKDITGFEVLEALPSSVLPMVIFVTAYDQYAVQAFEVFAFDYLLKPFKAERFHQSLHRAIKNLRRTRPAANEKQLRSILEYLKRTQNDTPKTIPIRMSGKVRFLELDNIRYIKASGYYIELFTHQKRYLIRESLSSIQQRLPQPDFLRIHRSTIINRHYLQEIIRLSSGDVEVLMKDEERFRVSRSYREQLFEELGI
jgi:two-component system LytT family response regulator